MLCCGRTEGYRLLLYSWRKFGVLGVGEFAWETIRDVVGSCSTGDSYLTLLALAGEEAK